MAEQNSIMLEVSGLKKQFGDDVVLDGVDLTIRKGEVVVILGSSGCGKSTLLRCINGLEASDGGSIRIDGDEVAVGSKSLTRLRQKIGMVFQNYELFPHKNILDNITLAPVKVQKRTKEDARAQAEQLLRRVGLWEKRKAYPRELSGGQKQRVAIVRALCMNPEIMLFDEVTAALDPEMVREVLDVMLELAQGGMTMLIVTHEMGFARAVADRIVFLEEGKVLENLPAEDFFENPDTQRAKDFLQTFEFKKKQ